MQIANKPNDLVSTFIDAPRAADDLRRTQLQRLSIFSDSERAAQELEWKRLEAKYGANSPQATAALARLDRLDQERASIKAEADRLAIPAPETKPESFVVYGRVLSSAGEVLRKLTVTAVDVKGAKLAKASTGNRDVFELRVPVGKPKGMSKAASSSTKKSEDSEGTPVLFQLQISGQKTKAIFKDTEVLQAVGERMTYREISVPEDFPLRASGGRSPSKNGQKRQ